MNPDIITNHIGDWRLLNSSVWQDVKPKTTYTINDQGEGGVFVKTSSFQNFD